MTDGADDVQTEGNITRNGCTDVTRYFSPFLPGNFDGDSADSVMDRWDDILSDGMTDGSDGVWTNGNLLRTWTVRYSPHKYH